MSFPERREKFDKLVARPLECKIRESKLLLHRQFLKLGNGMVASSSFGKDSTVLVHLAIQINPRIRVVFNNTRTEFKETLEQRDWMVKRFNLNFIEIKPEMAFMQIWKEYGVPGRSRTKTREPKCCQILKTRPMKKYCKENDVTGIIVGILGTESEMRRFVALRDGPEYYAKSYWKLWKIHPLLYWTIDDIWEYHDKYMLRKNKAYDRYDIHRTGCAPCTNHPDWERQVKAWNPAIYKRIKEMTEVIE